MVFIYISGATPGHNRTLLNRYRRAWCCQRTFYEYRASYAAGKSQMARLHQYRRIHRRRISNGISHRDVSKWGWAHMKPSRKRAMACRRCRGTWHRNACRTTSNFCLTSDALTWVWGVRGIQRRGQPTNACETGTCWGSESCTASCSRSRSMCYHHLYCCSLI